MTASFGWTTVVVVETGAEVVSSSRGTGEPSRERLSGVWTPLEWAERTPEWLGEAGALLGSNRRNLYTLDFGSWGCSGALRPLTWRTEVRGGSESKWRLEAVVSWRPARWAWLPMTGLSSRRNLCRAPPATVPPWWSSGLTRGCGGSSSAQKIVWFRVLPRVLS